MTIPTGRRIRLYREGENLTQLSLATRAGISVDHLASIERGVRSPSIATLDKLATALGLAVPMLIGETSPAAVGAAAVHRAMVVAPILDGDQNEVDVEELDKRIEDAYQRWNTSPNLVSELTDLLPDLLRDAETAVHGLRTPAEARQRAAAQRTRARVYWLTRSYARQLKRPELAILASDRGLHAAEATEDPVLVAVARYNLAHGLLVANEVDAVEEVATSSAAALRPLIDDNMTALGVWGQLHLVAAVASERNRDHDGARAHLREADQAAIRTGELNPYWTNFGPSNVAIHWVSIEAMAGRPDAALTRADGVNLPAVTSINRRCTYFLDVARCYQDRGDAAAAAFHLLQAEREAPEFLKYGPLALDLVRTLSRKPRMSYAADIRALSRRMGVD